MINEQEHEKKNKPADTTEESLKNGLQIIEAEKVRADQEGQDSEKKTDEAAKDAEKWHNEG